MTIRKKGAFRFLISLMVTISLLFTGIPAAVTASSESGIMINVVFDDSSSMVVTKRDGKDVLIKRWSQAKYAMEVFCAMMGENDIMNIYPMSKEGKSDRTVYGSDANRVQTIHEMNSKYANTPFKTVSSAANDLMQADDSYEKWLVIITDGSFDNGSTSQDYVQNKLDEYNKKGIKTVYLAIGDRAPSLQSNPAMNAYAEKAADGPDLLKKVTNIANQIFEHLVLPAGFIKTNGTINTLSFDIPTNQIVVFAQGDEVSVGAMSHNGQDIQPKSVEHVKYSDDKPKNFPGAEVDTSLKGIVVTFDSGSDPFPGGDYTITVSNAKTVEFYYNPGVVVNCGLLYDGRTVQSEDKLYAGEYKAEMNFINPLTNEPVQSELLASVDFLLRIDNNGVSQTVSSQTGTVMLEEGDVTLSAVAQLPGSVQLSNTREYRVFPEPVKLAFAFASEKNSYTQDEIGPEAIPILLHATDSLTGEEITEEEWKSAQVSITQAGGIRWNAECADQVGYWYLTPVSADGTLSSIAVGDTEFTAEVTFDYEGQYAQGADEFSIHVDEYAGNSIKFEIALPEGPFTLSELEDLPEEKHITVTAYAENPMTGEYEVLSPELWEAMDLQISTEKRMTFSAERGSEAGTWHITPSYYLNDSLMTDSGDIKMKIAAEAELGELRYRGNAERTVTFAPLSLEDVLPILLPRLITLFLLLWATIGHLRKKRIPSNRKMDPHCKYRGKQSAKRKIHKEWITVLWPNGPERAKVACRNADFKCEFDDLRIEAAGRNSFRIINKRLPLNRIKICGQIYKNMEDLKKEKFSYSTFDITSINPRENNRTLGTFTFL